MSEKITLDGGQMATLADALAIAAQALYYNADVLDSANQGTLAALFRNRAEDMEMLLAVAPQVERIVVRLTDTPIQATRIVF